MTALLDQYRARIVDVELDELLAELPALALEGPKGVGKTATAKRRATTIYQLDDPVVRALVQADPRAALTAPPPVLIDEWQRVPDIWDAVRRSVDADRSPNRILLTGSAAPESPPTHSGAGRIVSLRMRPLSLAERQLARPTVSLGRLLTGRAERVTGSSTVTLRDYAREVVASGFPGVRELTPRARRAQLDGYLARLVDRDFAENGFVVRRPQALRRWLAAYAASTAATTSFEKLRRAATYDADVAPTKGTVASYHEVLQRLWIVDDVPGWLPSRNPLTRLTLTPKHHLADPALAARLLGVDEDALLHETSDGADSLRDGPLLGALFESLVTQSVRVYSQRAEARVHHLRTRDGRREVDLIVERADHRVLAIEVKLSGTVDEADVQGLHWLREQIGEDLLDAIVVTSGPHAYRRADGIAVVPAALLGP